jgi:hypothetical protein
MTTWWDHILDNRSEQQAINNFNKWKARERIAIWHLKQFWECEYVSEFEEWGKPSNWLPYDCVLTIDDWSTRLFEIKTSETDYNEQYMKWRKDQYMKWRPLKVWWLLVTPTKFCMVPPDRAYDECWSFWEWTAQKFAVVFRNLDHHKLDELFICYQS